MPAGTQLTLDMRELWIVRNYWSPVLHVSWEDGMTAWHEDQTESFTTICAAIEFCVAHGRHPDKIFTGRGESDYYRRHR